MGEALRRRDHDVSFVVDSLPSGRDEDVLELANRDQRILLTYDKDFGELVFIRNQPSQGVILVRMSAVGADARTLAVVRAVDELGERLVDAFAVVVDDRVRLRKLR